MRRALFFALTALAACGTIVDTSAPGPAGDAGANDGGGGTESGPGPSAPDGNVPGTPDTSVDPPPDAAIDAGADADATADAGVPDSSTGKEQDAGDAGVIDLPFLCSAAAPLAFFCDDFENGERSAWSTPTDNMKWTIGQAKVGHVAIADAQDAGVAQSLTLPTSGAVDLSFGVRVTRKPTALTTFFRLDTPNGDALYMTLDKVNRLQIWRKINGTLDSSPAELSVPDAPNPPWFTVRVRAYFDLDFGYGELYFNGDIVGPGNFQFHVLRQVPTMTLGLQPGSNMGLELDDVIVK